MPPVFQSGQFPPGACGQVRPVGATLPTAARRASSREAADSYTLSTNPGRQSHRETRHSRSGALSQGQAAATPAWTGAEF